MQLRNEILKTLLYYDIWSFPLTDREIFSFLPVNSMSFEQFKKRLDLACEDERIEHTGDYYYARGHSSAVVEERLQREKHARRLWRAARLSTHVIKRFPFVRGVFVSGDLSKNATHPGSDIDFFIVTEPGRLWIARWLLILFKKTILLNRKKFFCLNSFISSDKLTLDNRNIYTATEVATLKPVYNGYILDNILTANAWIQRYFPNFNIRAFQYQVAERQSIIQKLLEFSFRLVPADRLDTFLMIQMEKIWRRRYPQFSDEDRNRLFRCTKSESRAYPGDFQNRILDQYAERLARFGVQP